MDPKEQSKGIHDQEPEPTLVDPVVHQFVQTRKIHRLYPPSNHFVKKAVEELRDQIGACSAGDLIGLDVDCEQLLFQKVPVLPTMEGARDLAHTLYLAHIESVEFDPDLSEQDILVFL